MAELVFDPPPAPPLPPVAPSTDRTPHFRFPFRMTRQGAATVEQDTVEDVTQCVYAVLATEIGERQEEPEYGVVDMAFLQGGADLEEIQTAVTEWEPRARLLSEDSWDGLVQTVTERVSVAND